MAGKPKQTRAETLAIDTIEKLKAIADPLRQQLLQEFAKRPATTKQVAEVLGYPPTRLYHHVAKLENSGLIRLVKTRPVRGATEKYYEAAAPTFRVDHAALQGVGANEAGPSMYLNVIDSVWTNIRNDIAEVLAESDAAADWSDEIVFLQAELDIDADTATELKARMLDVLHEVDAAAADRPALAPLRRKYRVTVGWHPRPTDK